MLPHAQNTSNASKLAYAVCPLAALEYGQAFRGHLVNGLGNRYVLMRAEEILAQISGYCREIQSGNRC